MDYLICDICKQKLRSLEALENHKSNIHGNPEDRTCDICSYAAPTKKILTEHHSIVHLKERSNKCDICGAVFAYSYRLKNHIKEQHDFDFIGYPCDKCDFLGQSKGKIQYHKKMKHDQKDKKTFDCAPCGKSYKTNPGLIYHNRSVHKKIIYNCEHCDSTFTHTSSMHKHIKEYHGEGLTKEYKCEVCGKILGTNENLKKHLKFVHYESQDKNHVCQECDFRAKEPSRLKTHINTVHLKVKSFKCDLCEESFDVINYLRNHMKSEHLDGVFSSERFNRAKLEKAKISRNINRHIHSY